MSNVAIYVTFALALAVAGMFAAAWIIERVHKSRMELADLGRRLISQDSQLPADEQRIVAWMLRKAYSPVPMIEVTAIMPISTWGLVVNPHDQEVGRSAAYESLRQRTEGQRFVQLFAVSIMAANIPVTVLFVMLSAILSPFLTMRGGTDRATVHAVDKVVTGHQHDTALAA